MSAAKPDWAVEGRDWPNREASRFVEAAGFRWHVQIMGEGPPALLLHGTGAATHTWRELAPLLARRFRVIAPDLPGHGFSATPPAAAFALPAMARAAAALTAALDAEPALIIGHSAGAAIAVRMALDGLTRPAAIVAVNGALLPFAGPAGAWMPKLARLLFLNPFAPGLFAWRAQEPAAVQRLLRGVGSPLEGHGLALYQRLLRTPGHVDGALKMMAHWDLAELAADLHRTPTPLTLVVGAGDRAVGPEQAEEVARRVPQAEVVALERLGHLAHEEAPAEVAAIIEAAAVRVGVLAA